MLHCAGVIVKAVHNADMTNGELPLCLSPPLARFTVSSMLVASCEVIVFAVATRALCIYTPNERALAIAALLSTSAAAGFIAFTTGWTLTEYVPRWITIESPMKQRLLRYLTATRAFARQRLHRPSSTLPVVGNTLDVKFIHKDRLHEWMAEQSRACGGKPWILSVVGQPPALVVTSVEACEDVLRTQFQTFDRVKTDYHGILSATSGASEQQRCAVARFFSTKTLRETVDSVVMKKADQVCELLVISAADDRVVSMNELLTSFSSDVFASIALSVDLNSLGSVNYRVKTEETEKASWMWRLQQWLHSGDNRSLKPGIETANDWMRMAMLERVQDQEQIQHRDLLSSIIKSGDPNAVQVACDAMRNLYQVSTTTTSIAMSWFLVYVSRNPRVLLKLRHEMRAKLPALGTNVPTMDDLARLPYLEATIKESLRLCMGSAWRSANASTTLSDGTFVPLGCQVLIPLCATARSTTVWGSDAAEFRPERFIDADTGRLKALAPFSSLSFVSQCAGRRFAMLEMKTLLASMVSRFDVHVVEDSVAVQASFGLMLPVKGDLKVHVRDVSDAKASDLDA